MRRMGKHPASVPLSAAECPEVVREKRAISWEEDQEVEEKDLAAKVTAPWLRVTPRGQTLLLLLLAVVFLLLLPGLALLQRMPVFVCCNLGLLALLAAFFFAAEELRALAALFGLRGAAAVHEGSFWVLVTSLATIVWLSAPDSPLRWLHDWWGGWAASAAVAAAASFAAHSTHRRLQRRMLTTTVTLPNRVSSIGMFLNNSLDELFQGREKLGAVEAAVRALEAEHSSLLPAVRTLRGYLRRTSSWRSSESTLALERKVLATLRSTTTDELNYLVRRLELGNLFHTLRDHLSARQHHRTELLTLLCDRRLHELKVRSRAMLLHGIQLARMPGRWAAAVLCGTQGEALTQLKNLCDSKGDIHSLHKLVFEDLKGKSSRDSGSGGSGDDDDISSRKNTKRGRRGQGDGGGGDDNDAEQDCDCVREQVIAHIAKEGEEVQHTVSRRRRGGHEHSDRLLLGRLNGRKVLSDIDDTLFSSGGRYPAGCDDAFPSHVLYPGVTAFYRELDLSIEGASAWERRARESCGGLVFLSARPKVGRDHKVERSSHRQFRRYRQQRMLHTTPSMLAGSLSAGLAMMGGGDLGPTAAKKFANFKEYASLYPEYKFIFIGDNGQADVAAAELMTDAFGDRIEAVYIHQVKPIEQTFGYEGPHTLDKWQHMGVHFFSTYVGAALHAASVVTVLGANATASPKLVGTVATIYDGGGQKRVAPLMHPQAVRRIALQAVAQYEETCTTAAERGWEALGGSALSSPLRSWRVRREAYARRLNRDVLAANALLAALRAASLAKVHVWFEVAEATAMAHSLRSVRLAVLPPRLGVGERVLHRPTNLPAVVISHGDIPAHAAEVSQQKRHHRSFTAQLTVDQAGGEASPAASTSGSGVDSGRSNSDDDNDGDEGTIGTECTPLIASANSMAAGEAAREEKHSVATPERNTRYELRLTDWTLAGGASVTVFAPAEDVVARDTRRQSCPPSRSSLRSSRSSRSPLLAPVRSADTSPSQLTASAAAATRARVRTPLVEQAPT